jgi:hypothetical protein
MLRAIELTSDQMLPVEACGPCHWTGAFGDLHLAGRQAARQTDRQTDRHGILARLRQRQMGGQEMRIRIRACSQERPTSELYKAHRRDRKVPYHLPEERNGAAGELKMTWPGHGKLYLSISASGL